MRGYGPVGVGWGNRMRSVSFWHPGQGRSELWGTLESPFTKASLRGEEWWWEEGVREEEMEKARRKEGKDSLDR